MGAGAGSNLPPAELADRLMAEIDRERQEKNWLAQRYEEKCKETQLLRQEIYALQSSACTSSAQHGARPESHTTQQGSLQKSMQAPVGQKTNGDAVQPSARNSPDVPDAKAARVEQGRQGLGASPVQSIDPYADEPMSALLRRRQEEWLVKNLPGAHNEQPAPASRSQRLADARIKTRTLLDICEETPLSLDIYKVAMSDLECPQSPKKKMKQSGRRITASKFATGP